MRFRRDELGVDKLLWGSDSPLGFSYSCTYEQAIDFVRVHVTFSRATRSRSFWVKMPSVFSNWGSNAFSAPVRRRNSSSRQAFHRQQSQEGCPPPARESSV